MCNLTNKLITCRLNPVKTWSNVRPLFADIVWDTFTHKVHTVVMIVSVMASANPGTVNDILTSYNRNKKPTKLILKCIVNYPNLTPIYST